MKAIYIFSNYSRGSKYGIGTYIEQLIKCTKNMGMSVNHVEIDSADCREVSAEIKNNIRYITIPKPSYAICEKPDVATYTDKLQKSTAWLLKEFIDDNDQNIFHLNTTDSVALAKELKENFQGDIVFTLHYTEWSMNLLGDIAKLKKIISKPQRELDTTENSIKKQFEREKTLICKYCDHIIAISEHSYDNLISIYGADPQKIRLINNGLTDNYDFTRQKKRSELREKYFIKKDEKVIIYAGRLDPVKGVHYLIEAFKKVLKVHPDSRLILSGGGFFTKMMSTSEDVWSKISFTGFLPKNKLYQLFAIADIGVMPSLHEEFGYVAVEMMMRGLPVIANDSTGLAEIIDDGITGLKADISKNQRKKAQSVDNLAGRMIHLLENTELQNSLRKNARRKYLRHYELGKFQRKMQEIYDLCYRI